MVGAPYERVVTSDPMRSDLQGYVDQLNAKLNLWEQVKKFIVLEHDLSVESGEVTPSMKMKRRVVEDNYREELDALYH
jgi:long-chain acyl-CoA synthetase